MNIQATRERSGNSVTTGHTAVSAQKSVQQEIDTKKIHEQGDANLLKEVVAAVELSLSGEALLLKIGFTLCTLHTLSMPRAVQDIQ